MAGIPADAEDWATMEFPEQCRIRMYRLVLDEVARRSPQTPVALCREKRRVWEALARDLRRMGQHPDDCVCNCGPISVGCDARLQKAVADAYLQAATPVSKEAGEALTFRVTLTSGLENSEILR